MKKHVILGVLGLAVTSVFTSCSKGSDLYDAGTIGIILKGNALEKPPERFFESNEKLCSTYFTLTSS